MAKHNLITELERECGNNPAMFREELAANLGAMFVINKAALERIGRKFDGAELTVEAVESLLSVSVEIEFTDGVWILRDRGTIVALGSNAGPNWPMPAL